MWGAALTRQHRCTYHAAPCVCAQGQANGKPHWSKQSGGSEQHIYWAPDRKRQWLLRSKFTPDKQICSAYFEGDDLRTGPNNWHWAKDRTWIQHPLLITQNEYERGDYKSDGAPGSSGEVSLEVSLDAKAAREVRLTRLQGAAPFAVETTDGSGAFSIGASATGSGSLKLRPYHSLKLVSSSTRAASASAAFFSTSLVACTMAPWLSL